MENNRSEQLKNLKDICLHNFTRGISDNPKELAEMVVLIQNQIYELAALLEDVIQETKKEGK